jgi:tripartite-type tricarboxylate transporter receptor subunit TctC
VPDGYTLIVSPPLPLTVANLLYRDITYQPGQFVPVALLAKGSNVLSVRKSFPAENVKELVAFGKANPGKITYASQGPGSTAHLSGAQLEVRAGIKMTHVPYRGAAPAINDLIAGHIDIFFDTVTTAVPLFRSDKIKILAVASPDRIDSVKELPTIAESGLPGFRSITWFAMAGPPKMPADLAARINRDIVEIMKRPEFDKRMQTLQLDSMIGSPADAAKFFAEETALWGGVIKEANVTIP